MRYFCNRKTMQKEMEHTSTLTAAQRQNLIDMLFVEGCSCVIRNSDTVRIFRERGFADLFRLLNTERDFLQGAFVADKVVGKAAAALMTLGSVQGVFADVISAPAREMLERAGIEVEYTIEVPHIMNRTQSDWCPVEKMCRECRTAEQCLPLIAEFTERIKQEKNI